MDIKIAREVSARIWFDQEMSSIVMDETLAEEIAQLLASRLTKRAPDFASSPTNSGLDPRNATCPKIDIRHYPQSG